MVAVVSGKRLVVAAGVSPATSVRSPPLLASGAAVALSRSKSADCSGRSTETVWRCGVLFSRGAPARQRKKQSGHEHQDPHDRKNTPPRGSQEQARFARVFGTLDFGGLARDEGCYGLQGKPMPEFRARHRQGYFLDPPSMKATPVVGARVEFLSPASGAGAVDRMMGQDAKDSRSYGVVPIMRPSARNREPRLLVLCAVCRECPGVNRILDT